MASVTASEGYSDALSRWKYEKTGLLSEGYGKDSNLEKSIIISLTSPRMTSQPTALKLLGILSVLPDGFRDREILSLHIPMSSVLDAKSILLRTSLAYIDFDGRLKTLSPIREFMRQAYPPDKGLIEPIENYWHKCLALWDTHQQVPGRNLVSQLKENVGNINSLTTYALETEGFLGTPVLHSMVTLKLFSERMLISDSSRLLPLVPKLIDTSGDRILRWRYLMLRLACSGPPVPAAEGQKLIQETLEEIVSANDRRNQGDACGQL
jgi:hypothetical protein